MSGGAFVATDTVLDRILDRKVEELAEARARASAAAMRRRAEGSAYATRDMLAALKSENVSLIAEVKRASPSKGSLTKDFAPVLLAATYAQNGASAISVLTDEDFFQGGLAYLTAIRRAVCTPLLRKDFIIDPCQVYEGRAAGADAILLIVAALAERQLADLYALTNELGMTALVEVHNEWEMERALRLRAKLIGINNRDLKTFHVDLGTTARLAAMVNDEVVLVAESGIFSAADARAMGRQGADAILVGEALMKAPDTALLARELSSQPNPKLQGRA
ncbi:MAG: indole-3-glycerol phosphate synthase TrpC [Chloroflexota bacterium]|nr:indole-3-glycerol phosphate synthase TrpC [Chloroflexota bacterium]MDE2907763.1 indole-3-glycerol phosphate synthase TrpC [Chloroflexota bacterium]